MTLRVVWICECGRVAVCGLPSGYCPLCRSSFVTLAPGNVRIVYGAWTAERYDDAPRASA